MRLSRPQLKMLLETLILNEGQVEDLLTANPQLGPALDLGIRNPSYLKWLLRMEKFEPIADMVGLIPAFEQNKQRLTIKDLNGYNNPNDLRAALEAAGESKGEQRRQLKESETDTVYNSETWLVVMPHTMESSIQWGKGTTWCTAATKSANLFYSYVGKKEENIILFYIIKKGANSALDPSAKLSVGFVNGKPVLDGKSGGVSVDAANIGLDEQKLRTVLADRYDTFMSAMKKHAASIGDKHPAKKAMQKIARAKDATLLDRYTRGMDEEQKRDFINTFLEYDVRPEILAKLARDKDPEIRYYVASIHLTPSTSLSFLSRDDRDFVRASAAYNINTPIEDLSLLAGDEDLSVRLAVAENERTPSNILAQLAVADHTLKNEKDVESVLQARGNGDIAFSLRDLSRIDKGKDIEIRASVACHPNTSRDSLSILASDKEARVRRCVAKNEKTPIDKLIFLLNDIDEEAKANVSHNPAYRKYIESQNKLTENWIRLAGLTKRN